MYMVYNEVGESRYWVKTQDEVDCLDRLENLLIYTACNHYFWIPFKLRDWTKKNNRFELGGNRYSNDVLADLVYCFWHSLFW